MREGGLRYFIGFVITIILIILLIIILLGGGGKSKTPTTTKTLDSYASTDAQVSTTIAGPIVANQNYKEVVITVDNQEVLYQQINGYENTVVNQQSFTNNLNAYTNFLFALEKAGFTEGDTSSSLSDDRGYCPLGRRYIFQITQDNNTIQRFWATSCGGTRSYKGNTSLTLMLFQNQVPGYSTLVQGLNL